MTSPIQIWTSAAYHPAFRCGGWASVRLARGQVSGAAGGERYTSAQRMALASLASALRDLPAIAAGGAVEDVSVRTTSPELVAFAAALAHPETSAQADGPDEDLDLWAQILAAAKHRRLTLVHAPAQPGAPTAFAAAWAELARDKAKATGPFTAAIPKTNLAKVPGLAVS